LKESFNYGLFCPPSNGKAGKFLDEERRLGDYPFNGPVGYLEVSIHVSTLLSIDSFHVNLINTMARAGETGVEADCEREKEYETESF
jgi:SH3 and multiple ankyrin repeat domains protein